MGQHNRKKKLAGMGFGEQLQHSAKDVVKDAEYLVANGVAVWQEVEMPDGSLWIALLFRPSLWELKDRRLTLKQPEGESDV